MTHKLKCTALLVVVAAVEAYAARGTRQTPQTTPRRLQTTHLTYDTSNFDPHHIKRHGPPYHQQITNPTARPAPTIGCARAAQLTMQADATNTDALKPADGTTKRSFKSWLAKWVKFDKKALGALGANAFFTYGVVSNLNAGATISLAWYTFCSTRGLSPLAPGQWSKFLIVYTGIYATLGTILRPFRMALAVTCTPIFDRTIVGLQKRLPYRTSRPRLNRTLALVLFTLVGNVLMTSGVIGAGCWLGSALSGVPAFPPGWVNPLRRAATVAA